MAMVVTLLNFMSLKYELQMCTAVKIPKGIGNIFKNMITTNMNLITNTNVTNDKGDKGTTYNAGESNTVNGTMNIINIFSSIVSRYVN